MKTPIRTGIGALGLIALVVGAMAAVVVGRTVTIKPPAAPGYAAAPAGPPIDGVRAAEHLSEAVRFKTISHENPADDDPKALADQRDWLARTYPHFAGVATRELVGGGALIWTWTGADPTLAPIILMAHQDVVPVADDTRAEWKADPFGGEIRDGAVWGRGSVDDKSTLIALMEATDALAADGFRPRRTVILVSGHDEEVGGTGARAAAAALKARGVSALFALDEGLFVISDFPLTGNPTALIGISEKGFATLRVTARSAGGHSSAPPKDTAATTVARAVTAIADHPFPETIDGPAAEMLDTLAPGMAFLPRMAIANRWLFGPLLKAQIGKTDAGRSLLHTTTAPTMLSGSPKANALPGVATARINYRIAPGDTTQSVMARARSAVGDLPVELAFDNPLRDPSPVSSTTSEGWRDVASATHATFPGTPVTPALVTAATDGAAMSAVARDVYRFQPIYFSLKDVEMLHGVNEHIRIDDLRRMADFYVRLIRLSAR